LQLAFAKSQSVRYLGVAHFGLGILPIKNSGSRVPTACQAFGFAGWQGKVARPICIFVIIEFNELYIM
jgi:hypothetical protein